MIPKFCRVFCFCVTCYVFLLLNIGAVIEPPKEDSTSKKAQVLPPCQACKTLVNSFIKGMERTSRGKFEGGDADWEEKKMRQYANSEVRLVEIQEKLCTDITRGENQCHNMAEVHESALEEWWFNQQSIGLSLHDWLCIQKLKSCCTESHYGADCKPCPGMPETECSGNGKCKGAGTRKGNGQCVCEKGYFGELCNKCSAGFYISYKDEQKILCTECHKSCKDVCTQPGPKGCVACNKGWVMDTELGCVDIDECIDDPDVCKKNTFCVNSPGSYLCMDCDESCNGCHGDGPDGCLECAEGFVMKDGICRGTKVKEQPWKAETLRYLTYFGMCLCSCIILQRSTSLAALVGLCVAAYISLAEYSLRSEEERKMIDST